MLAVADSGSRIPEANEGNNTTASTAQVDYKFWVGDVGSRKNVAFDAFAGGPLEFDLNGGGVGKVIVSGGIVDLSYEGTTAKSVGLIRGNGNLNLRNVTANAVMNSVSLAANVTGTANFNGGLGGLAIRELGGPASDASLNIAAGFPKPAVLAFTRVENSNITVDGEKGIRLFLARQWVNTNATPDVLSAASLKFMEINPLKTGMTPNFEANVNIIGTPYDAEGHVVGRVRVGGFIKNSFWAVGGDSTKLIKEINPTAAENFRLLTSTHVERIEIPTNYTNSNVNLTSLNAGSFGTIQIKGDISIGPIQADYDDTVINILDLGNVNRLPQIYAPLGGIKEISAKNWPARTVISALWINKITVRDSSAFPGLLFAPDLHLYGVNPERNLALGAVDIRGGIIAGTSNDDRAIWSFSGDVGSIDATYTEHWQVNGNLGGGVGGKIGRLDIFKDMINSHLTFLGANLIAATGFRGSSFTTPGNINNFIQKNTSLTGLTSVFTSVVEANQITRILLRDVDGSFPSAFGVKARSILRYDRFVDGAIPPGSRPQFAGPGTYDVVGNFSVQILP